MVKVWAHNKTVFAHSSAESVIKVNEFFQSQSSKVKKLFFFGPRFGGTQSETSKTDN